MTACSPAAYSSADENPDAAATTTIAKVDAGASAVPAPSKAVDAPGPIELETIVSARWAIPLGGLVNLQNPVARVAGLTNEVTPIVLVVHVLRHPTRGLFIVDTGVTRQRLEAGLLTGTLLSGVTPVTPLADILAREGKPLAGVLFTHMHIDHVLGLPEIPLSTPLFAGRGELEVTKGSTTSALNEALLGKTFDQLVRGHDLRFWDFESAPAFENVKNAIDVFDDGSLFALHVPGHTEGSVAFFVRTTKGPVLLTGDCSHTIWGWEKSVEPGILSEDLNENVESLHVLEKLAAAHPTIRVLVGHETDGVGTGVHPK
jgi:glyoxylase-like metal-dependent hydrolase (beta-lactamase superfamily II)